MKFCFDYHRNWDTFQTIHLLYLPGTLFYPFQFFLDYFLFVFQHKEKYLIINDKQSVKLKSGSISFKNYFKQLPVPFKIYANFECLLKGVKSSD